jgi:3-polyprenyl-4-hydroxybenzoate decarboxylase
MENLIKKHNERMKQLDLSIVSGSLSDDDAALIIENVIDTLVEVGNGTTDEELHKAADYLFALRDKWFHKRSK